MSIKLGCDLKSEEDVESAGKTFAADLDFDNNAPTIFDRSCHSFLIRALF